MGWRDRMTRGEGGGGGMETRRKTDQSSVGEEGRYILEGSAQRKDGGKEGWRRSKRTEEFRKNKEGMRERIEKKGNGRIIQGVGLGKVVLSGRGKGVGREGRVIKLPPFIVQFIPRPCIWPANQKCSCIYFHSYIIYQSPFRNSCGYIAFIHEPYPFAHWGFFPLFSLS